jgi:hypothetical protein
MWRTGWIAWLAVLVVGVMGCGGSDETGQGPGTGGGEAQSGGGAGGQTGAGQSGPAAAVFEFLEAVRTGDDEKAALMLTELARQKTAKLNMEVAPEGSDTAEFKVGEAELLPGDRARVASTWSDLDHKSQRQTDEIVWMLRRQPDGWRIAGVAAAVFPGEPPLLLNFEDPEEMLRKQEWVQQEIRRRAQQENLRAQGGENSENSIRR